MILVLNCGSQSVKWKLFDENLSVLQAGNSLNDLPSIKEDVGIIGHRVVHGGLKFFEPIEINDENLQELEKISHLALLHNPFNIEGIKACRKVFTGKKNIAVFDTEFFKDLPYASSAYALPKAVIDEFGFKRLGFHGTSHEYVANCAAKKLKKPIEKLKIITCHLGGGASCAAIKNGKAVDTSMGFTPLEGLAMMTRSGNIDAGVVLELVRRFGLDNTQEILNKKSGVKGICGEGNFLKVLENMRLAGDSAQYKKAFDVFVYSTQKYIGAYYAILGGCDILVFTGAIGSGDPLTREAISKLAILKKTKILTIETDEELAIAQKIKNL